MPNYFHQNIRILKFDILTPLNFTSCICIQIKFIDIRYNSNFAFLNNINCNNYQSVNFARTGNCT